MTGSILIVDDSLTVRMNLMETLEAAGLTTVACASGGEARRALAKQQFALVILDIMLPDADGIDILKEIRDQPLASGTAVMLLSTEADVHDRIRGLKTGADEYIGKPYESRYVVARAREIVGRRQTVTKHQLKSILVIDDSLTFCHSLKDILEQAGYFVLTAGTGEEGLQLAADARPTAIVVDGDLPGIDGPNVIRRIRLDAALRRTPCLLLTADENRNAELNALESGADAFVTKIEDVTVILAKLNAMLRGAENSGGDQGAASLLGPKRILAVDDSETFLQELAAALHVRGYEVVLAHSGEDAIDLLMVQPVDCILLDLLMPGIGGQETCKRIKDLPKLSDIPIVMLTALEDRNAMIMGLSVGADDFIAKSSDFEVLNARIQAQLRRRQFEYEHRLIRERLLQKELETTQARAAQEIAETRAVHAEELEIKNRQLQENQTQLVHAAKMASLGQLVAGIAHEINNPLTYVIANQATIDKLLNDSIADSSLPQPIGDRLEKARNRLDGMMDGLGRIRDIIINLRTFSRLDEGEFKRISISKSIESILMILRSRLDGRIEIVKDYGADDTLDCSPAILNQVVMNLLTNAIDAIDGMGTITIRTRLVDGCYAIAITDTGMGIPPEIVPRIFEPFFTTKPVDAGTGLGLAIAYSIVKTHRGSITVDSTPGNGSTFTVTLPCS